MKVIIKYYARGQELAIGSTSQETWDHIQDEYDGDANSYIVDICLGHRNDNDDRYIADICLNHCNDDLFHKTAGWFDSGCIEITNDKGKTIYECSWNEIADFEQSGIQFDLTHETVNRFVRYISVFSSPKGIILTGEFDIEGEFDPTKLKV